VDRIIKAFPAMRITAYAHRERSELLLKIKGILKDASVSPALWACCQLADMNRLQAITKWEEEVINSYHKSLAVIAMKCELLRF
jgi:hypothetical protein